MLRVVNIHKKTCDIYMGRAGHRKDGYFENPFNQYGRECHVDIIVEYLQKI